MMKKHMHSCFKYQVIFLIVIILTKRTLYVFIWSSLKIMGCGNLSRTILAPFRLTALKLVNRAAGSSNFHSTPACGPLKLPLIWLVYTDINY